LRPVDRVRVIGEKRGRQIGEERRDQEPAAGGGEIVRVAIRCGWQHAREVFDLSSGWRREGHVRSFLLQGYPTISAFHPVEHAARV
jgi:hypothetical protein